MAATATKGPAAARVPVSEVDPVEVAAKYILLGSYAVGREELAAAQEEIARRLALARAMGMTERDMVRAVLRSAFAWERRCHCRACRDRCAICRARGSVALASNSP